MAMAANGRIVAARVISPEGVLWHAGSVYVAVRRASGNSRTQTLGQRVHRAVVAGSEVRIGVLGGGRVRGRPGDQAWKEFSNRRRPHSGAAGDGADGGWALILSGTALEPASWPGWPRTCTSTSYADRHRLGAGKGNLANGSKTR